MRALTRNQHSVPASHTSSSSQSRHFFCLINKLTEWHTCSEHVFMSVCCFGTDDGGVFVSLCRYVSEISTTSREHSCYSDHIQRCVLGRGAAHVKHQFWTGSREGSTLQWRRSDGSCSQAVDWKCSNEEPGFGLFTQMLWELGHVFLVTKCSHRNQRGGETERVFIFFDENSAVVGSQHTNTFSALILGHPLICLRLHRRDDLLQPGTCSE